MMSPEQVSQLLSTRMGQYLLSHPAFAQTLLLFAAFAVLPVALFLAFAVVTFIISAAGFVFFQGRCDCLSILTLELIHLVVVGGVCSHRPVVCLLQGSCCLLEAWACCARWWVWPSSPWWFLSSSMCVISSSPAFSDPRSWQK